VAPRNILFGELNQAVLADFGLSRRVQPLGEGNDHKSYQRTEGLVLPIRWYVNSMPYFAMYLLLCVCMVFNRPRGVARIDVYACATIFRSAPEVFQRNSTGAFEESFAADVRLHLFRSIDCICICIGFLYDVCVLNTTIVCCIL
jgi:serine/threonine protein kinase